MAKTHDKKKQKKKAHGKSSDKSASSQQHKSPSTPVELLAQATDFLQQGQPQLALSPAQTALSSLQTTHGSSSLLTLPALSLVAEIRLDLGDVPAATSSFKAAATLDPDGAVPDSQGGGADKFLNLAQLDETGGEESLKWFEMAVACLTKELADLSDALAKKKDDDAALELEIAEKKLKMAHALCGMCELWMTDLSFNDEAESKCEALITQAVMVAPEDAQTLQTLASIRLSQQRVEDAQEALKRSVSLWEDLPNNHPLVPDFPVRIALARTLMEAGMEDVASEVCDRLIGEDDQSIEAWYLGGWCRYLMAQDGENGDDDDEMKEDAQADEGESLSADEKKSLLLSSRECLRHCLKIYQALDYEDERLRDHAKELVASLDAELGGAEIEDEEDEWEGIDSDDEDGVEDQDMDES